MVWAYVRMANRTVSLQRSVVIFAISQEAVSFDGFARLFRDGQKCPNALFLDGGSVSSLYAPTLNHPSNVVPLGPMLAVFETNKAHLGNN
jgi:uncharacterized protein YigE (DUF2233 family)